MPYARKLPEPPPQVLDEEQEGSSLRDWAVAIDPPPPGAVGIEELLGRFEQFAEAGSMTNPPEDGAVGVRELLARLGNLAESGHFSSGKDDETGEN